MRVNTAGRRMRARTHEGGPAYELDAFQMLRRSLASCLLWEGTFYEDGVAIAERLGSLVAALVQQGRAKEVRLLTVQARRDMNLRHAPLLLCVELARRGALNAATVEAVLQRADEPAELLALYWKDGRCKLAKAIQKGIARALPRFSAHQLAKYDRPGAVRLRDALFLSHAKPRDAEQEAVWRKLIDGTLEPPDTWEVALSAGADKRKTWERLIREGKLGALALIRNLRNMEKAAVPAKTVRDALLAADTARILPYRFIAAAAAAPRFEPELEQLMFRAAAEKAPLQGETTILVDVSGSMDYSLSAKSAMTRLDAACALAMLARERCEHARVYAFSERIAGVPPRRGFALRDAIVNSMRHTSTYLGRAVSRINKLDRPDRLIVITDEQSHDEVPGPAATGYLVNVGTYEHGVGYGPWTHIDGFSSSVLDFIAATE